MQNEAFWRRKTARARAAADRNYLNVGYLDALLHASSVSPYPLDSKAGQEWSKGYQAGQRELAKLYPTMKATVL